MTCQLETYQQLELNMQHNEFVCGCSSLHFVHWVQNTAVKLTGKDFPILFRRQGACIHYEDQLPEAVSRLPPTDHCADNSDSSLGIHLLLLHGSSN